MLAWKFRVSWSGNGSKWVSKRTVMVNVGVSKLTSKPECGIARGKVGPGRAGSSGAANAEPYLDLWRLVWFLSDRPRSRDGPMDCMGVVSFPVSFAPGFQLYFKMLIHKVTQIILYDSWLRKNDSRYIINNQQIHIRSVWLLKALPSLQDLPVPSVSADGSVKLGGASVMRRSAFAERQSDGQPLTNRWKFIVVLLKSQIVMIMIKNNWWRYEISTSIGSAIFLRRSSRRLVIVWWCSQKISE